MSEEIRFVRVHVEDMARLLQELEHSRKQITELQQHNSELLERARAAEQRHQ